MPDATTVKVAFCPTITPWLEGWVMMDGAEDPAVTLSTAALLVMLPAALLTMTLKVDPLSDTVVAGVV